MVVAKVDIASRVVNRVASIPSTLTASSNLIIQEYVEDSHIKIENKTGDSFATTDIPTKYQPVITDMSIISVLEYMIKKSISIGEITIAYRDMVTMRDSLRKDVEEQLNQLCRGSTTGSIVTTAPSVPITTSYYTTSG